MADFNNVSSLFGNSSNSLYDSLGQLSSIKSGAYKTVLKAYYKKTSDNSDSEEVKKAKKTEENIANRLTSDAGNLSEAAKKLNDKKLFEEKEIVSKDEDGKEVTTKGVDMDSIYKLAKNFVDSYNSFIDNASESNSKSVLNQTLHLTTQVKGYAKTFGAAGITIGKDNKLEIDEEDFKKASVGTIKGLMLGNASSFQQISSRASMIDITATSEVDKKKNYTKTGDYSELTTGSIIDSLF